jgi:hypothetical protein
MAVCKKDYNQAGELWKKAKADLEACCTHYKFPGRAEQPVIQIQGVVKLLAALPCEERVRAQANETLAKHIDNVVESERIKIDMLKRTLAAIPCEARVRAQANETLSKHSDKVVESEKLKIEILRKTADIQARALEERLKIENEAFKKEMELKVIINCAMMLNKKPAIVDKVMTLQEAIEQEKNKQQYFI